jgi:hypothetical protein
LLIKGAVLIRHPVANRFSAKGLHALGNADMGLQLLLASVPR